MTFSQKREESKISFTMTASCRCCSWISTPVLLLLCIILFQWLLLTFLLSRHETMESFSSTLHLGATHCALCRHQSRGSSPFVANNTSRSNISMDIVSSSHTQWEGVAVGLMLRRPKWFYKRYHVMISTVLTNIPQSWAIQLFVNQEWFQGELLEYHRGLQRLISGNNPRIIITPLPEDLKSLKPKDVLPSSWFWNHIVADRVLLFHGDGTLCSNTKKTWNDFVEYDYVGVPWGYADGYGGKGTEFSLRSRKAMLDALQYRPYKNGQQEDKYFVSTLLEMNQQNNSSNYYKIAPPQVTQWFAGVEDIVGDNNSLREDESFGPMIVSGTHAELTDEQRNWLLGTCPEIKVVYPVLHNPNCFGAKPNMEECSYVITGIRPSDGK